MALELPSEAIRTIETEIEDLFDRVKKRFLGPHIVPKRLYVGFQRTKSLPGVYEAAIEEGIARPNRKTLEQLINIASNYLDGVKAGAKAKIINSITSFINEANASDVDFDKMYTKLGGDLAELFADLKYDVNRIIDSESQKAKNTGRIEDITKVAASLNIDDPTVFFITSRDADVCEECKRLHLLEDGITPRVWRLSELGHGYHKRGDSVPKVAELHPFGRCTLTILTPGFGFNKSGYVTWIKYNHLELEKQRE